MGKHSNEDWYKAEVKKYFDKYGDIPPPWVITPDSHPYSMRWRMGAGETFLMVFFDWFSDEFKDETERISYFKKYPPPPRWLAWMADMIWDLEPPLTDREIYYRSYLEKLDKLGFEGTRDYEQDLNDNKWSDGEAKQIVKLPTRISKAKNMHLFATCIYGTAGLGFAVYFSFIEQPFDMPGWACVILVSGYLLYKSYINFNAFKGAAD